MTSTFKGDNRKVNFPGGVLPVIVAINLGKVYSEKKKFFSVTQKRVSEKFFTLCIVFHSKEMQNFFFSLLSLHRGRETKLGQTGYKRHKGEESFTFI